MCKKKNKQKIFKKLMVRKPLRSYRAYKEWAPSVKLLQQNINRILTELYMHLLEISPKFNSPTPFLGTLDNAVIWMFPSPVKRILTVPSNPHPSIPWRILLVGRGGIPLWEADIVHFLLKCNSTEKFITGLSMHLLCKQFDRTYYDNFCYMFRCEEHLKLQDCLSQNIIANKY